ncbi:MAG: glycosyltransferase family 2 protein [Nitrospiraceae bacterium]|nr:glycosyltransferase family 2 protein [Nitrospiraceae bacterium]
MPTTWTSTRPLVSVVIPTHNRAKLLKRAIESVLAQEGCGCLFDIEIIVVDDCSSDNTGEVARRYPSVQYVRLLTNRGASGARNEGIRRAAGKYIALLDDDDEFLTLKLQVQVPLLEANPQVGALYGQSVVTGSDVPLLLWPESGPSGDVFEAFVTQTDDFLHPPTWLIRRECFEAAGWFDEQHRTMEHYDMALRLALVTKWMFVSGGPVARGRFSRSGKWYSNIVNGNNERHLSRIVEGALARLPDSPHTDQLRQKARAAVVATVIGQRWAVAGVTAAQGYTLSILPSAPWLVNEPCFLGCLHRMAGALTTTSDAPEQAVCSFWREIEHQLAEGGSTRSFLAQRRLLGELLAQAAIRLKAGSPRRAWIVAATSIVMNPSSWFSPKKLTTLVSSLRQPQ